MSQTPSMGVVSSSQTSKKAPAPGGDSILMSGCKTAKILQPGYLTRPRLIKTATTVQSSVHHDFKKVQIDKRLGSPGIFSRPYPTVLLGHGGHDHWVFHKTVLATGLYVLFCLLVLLTCHFFIFMYTRIHIINNTDCQGTSLAVCTPLYTLFTVHISPSFYFAYIHLLLFGYHLNLSCSQ